MAGPKRPAVGGQRGRGRGGRPTPARARPRASAAELDQLLDRFEEAMLAGRAAEAQALSEQLWEQRAGVPAALTARLRAGRARIPMLAFELLGSFAGEEASAYLKQIAADPQ